MGKDLEILKKSFEDAAIAENELKKMNLYPEECIVADFYCIPSHNFPAYYVLLYKNGIQYEITYIRNEIYNRRDRFPIKMYTFADCAEAEKHAGWHGRYIMGIKSIPDDFAKKIISFLDALPNIYISNRGIFLDGIFQMIRVYGDSNEKIITYRDKEKIDGLSSAQTEFGNNLYIEIAGLIEDN